MRRLVHPVVFGLVLVAGAAELRSQAPVPPSEPSPSVLRGTVSGPDGEPLPGATVTVVNEASGRRRTTTTTATGAFQIRASPGTYKVVAEMEGFNRAILAGVSIRQGQSNRVSLVLAGPVPPGEPGRASDDRETGSGDESEDRIVRSLSVVEKSFDDDLELQAWLNEATAAGADLLAVVPSEPGTSLFVHRKAADEPVFCTVLPANEPLQASRLRTRISQHAGKRFAGLHHLDTDTYALVLCDES